MAPGAVSSEVRQYLLTSLLKDVSRTFYLTLRILPQPIRSQIGLAYLLARTSDTIADTEVLPLQARLGALRDFRDALQEQGAPLALSNFLEGQGNPAERVLMSRAQEIVRLLSSCQPGDSQRIRSLLETIISGQELDLVRFTGASADQIKSLQSGEELDDYTYRVAGCVGEFWTHMCLAHLKGRAPEANRLIENGIRFGKGLQLINILRDLPADLRAGRCYLPGDELAKLALRPADLLRVENESTVRPLYNSWLDLARDHLEAGWEYTISLPSNWRRVRLACSWPILIGLATLRRLRAESILDASHRIKVSRNEIYRIQLRSVLFYPFRKKWERLART